MKREAAKERRDSVSRAESKGLPRAKSRRETERQRDAVGREAEPSAEAGED